MGYVIANQLGWYYAGQHDGWDLWSMQRAAAWCTVHVHVARSTAVRLANDEGRSVDVRKSDGGHVFTVNPALDLAMPAPTHARSMRSGSKCGCKYTPHLDWCALHPNVAMPRTELNTPHTGHYHCHTCGTCLGHPNDCHECSAPRDSYDAELRRGS